MAFWFEGKRPSVFIFSFPAVDHNNHGLSLFLSWPWPGRHSERKETTARSYHLLPVHIHESGNRGRCRKLSLWNCISYLSYFYNPNTWFSGILLLFFLMAIAFMGYVLPFGQMSFWGATVITNLLSPFPFINHGTNPAASKWKRNVAAGRKERSGLTATKKGKNERWVKKPSEDWLLPEDVRPWTLIRVHSRPDYL